MQRTRQVILDFLKQRGQASLEELAQESGLASMTVRGHLSVLERDGLVAYEEVRGKVGRPRFVYSLTEQGNDVFPKSYHVLCNRILDAVTATTEAPSPVGQVEGGCGVSKDALVERVAESWAAEYADQMTGKSFDEKVQLMAAIRTDEGAMACIEPRPEGYLLQQHHCPASCVAARHPEIVCASELAYMKRLLGVPVERVNWLMHGDCTCSYLVRRPGLESTSDPNASETR